MANSNVAGFNTSWVQGSIAAIQGASVGPIGGGVAPVPPGDDFLLAIKPADTTRTNDNTLSDDPDLVITGLAAGEYAYEIFLECTAPSSTPDIQYRLQETAGVMTGPRVGYEQFESGAAAAIEIKAAGGVDSANNPPIIANLTTWVRQTGYFTLSVGADVALQWAQNTLDAVNGTTLNQGSWLRVEAANV